MKSENRNKVRRIIGPGIWEDENGNFHWSITDLLKMVELEDTPENRAEVTNMLKGLIAANNPEATIIQRQTPND